MSTLAEIQAAVEALPPEQKEELLRFLTARLRSTEQPRRGARLVGGPDGTALLEAATAKAGRFSGPPIWLRHVFS